MSTQINEQGNKIIYTIYLYHTDNLSKLKPLLILGRGRIWNGGVKPRMRNSMYYVFHNRNYIKLWKDKNGNLLYYFGYHDSNLLSYEKPELLIPPSDLQWGVDVLWVQGTKLSFDTPIFNLIWGIDKELWEPTAYVLAKLYLDQADQNGQV
jgi:hypothetical protein